MLQIQPARYRITRMPIWRNPNQPRHRQTASPETTHQAGLRQSIASARRLQVAAFPFTATAKNVNEPFPPAPAAPASEAVLERSPPVAAPPARIVDAIPHHSLCRRRYRKRRRTDCSESSSLLRALDPEGNGDGDGGGDTSSSRS